MYDDSIMSFLTTIPYLVCKAIVCVVLPNEKLEDTKHFLLGEVKRLGKKVRYEDINKSLHYSKAVVSKQIKKLEETGFLITYDDEINKNRKWVELTETGDSYTQSWIDLLNACEAPFFNNFDNEEKSKFVNYLRIFYSNLPDADFIEVNTYNDWLEIFHFFVIIYRYTQHFYRTAVDDDGNFMQELRVLTHLEYNKDWTEFKKLEEILNMSQPKIVRSVSSLYKKGFVNVRTNPLDGRRKQAIIRTEGYAKSHELIDFYYKIKETGLRNFTENQRIEFYEILSKWEKNISDVIRSIEGK